MKIDRPWPNEQYAMNNVNSYFPAGCNGVVVKITYYVLHIYIYNIKTGERYYFAFKKSFRDRQLNIFDGNSFKTMCSKTYYTIIYNIINASVHPPTRFATKSCAFLRWPLKKRNFYVVVPGRRRFFKIYYTQSFVKYF